MPRQKRHTPDFLALQRRQLDAKLLSIGRLRSMQPARKGWIRTIRTTLGMTSAQLGKRLGMSRQGVLDLERREGDETITLGTLKKAANALNSDLVVALIPRKSLEDTVHEQAKSKAEAERNRVAHTMRLEAQEVGTEKVLDEQKDIETWLTKRIGRLWD